MRKGIYRQFRGRQGTVAAWPLILGAMGRALVALVIFFFLGGYPLFAQNLEATAKLIHRQLGNGLTVLIKPVKFTPVVAVNFWVRVGSMHETDGEAGMAHCLEHMLFKGTETLPPGELDRQVKMMGGKTNAFTSYDYTCFYVVAPLENLDRVLEIQADALMNSVINAEEFQREKQVILEEFNEGQDNPDEFLYDNLIQKAFTRHTYRRPIIGSRESIESFTQDHIWNFYRKWYTPENMAVVVAGDVDPASVTAKIASVLEGWDPWKKAKKKRPTDLLAHVVPEPPQDRERSLVLYGDLEQCYINLAYHVPGIDSPDIFALDVLDKVLSAGNSSRLYQALIARNLLANHVSSAYHARKSHSLFHFNLHCKPSKLGEAMEVLQSEIDKVRNGEIGEAELRRARQIITATDIFDNETVEEQAQNIGELWAFDRLDLREDYLNRVRGVTREEVKRVATTYFSNHNRSVGSYLPHTLHEVRSERIPMENGVRFFIKESHATPIVSLVLLIDGGGRYEPKNKIGLANLLQRLIFKGTKSRTAAEIATAFESLGTHPFASANSSHLTLGFTSLSTHFNESFDIFFDCLTNATFPLDEFDRGRELIQSEIKSRNDELWPSTFDKVLKELFPNHPLGEPVLGTMETIRTLTREDVVQYFQKYYLPRAYTLVIAGDFFYKDEAEFKIRDTFGKLPNTEIFYPKISPGKALDGKREVVIRKNKEQSLVIVGNLGVPAGHPDRPGLEVLNAILSGSMYSRLPLNLRDKQALAYDTGSIISSDRDTGFFLAYISTSMANREVAKKGLLTELETIRAGQVSEQEIAEAKRYLIGTELMNNDSIEGSAMSMALNDFMGLGFNYAQVYPEAVNKVTLQDLKRIIDEFVLPANHIIATTLWTKEKEAGGK